MVSIVGRPRTGKTSPAKTPSGALADMFKALSDPIRLTILRHLKKGGINELELADLMQFLPRALLSQHLTILREQSLVKACRDSENSRWMYYSLDKEVLSELDRQCSKLFDTTTTDNNGEDMKPAEETDLSLMAEVAA